MITCQMIISRDQGKTFAEEHPAFRIAAHAGSDEELARSATPPARRRRRELSTQLATVFEAWFGSAIRPRRLFVGRWSPVHRVRRVSDGARSPERRVAKLVDSVH